MIIVFQKHDDNQTLGETDDLACPPRIGENVSLWSDDEGDSVFYLVVDMEWIPKTDPTDLSVSGVTVILKRIDP